MMEMDDNKLKRFLQDELDKEADQLMEKVNRDPDVKDAVAPDSIFEKLQKQIQEHEQSKVEASAELTPEDQELIRLGKIYRKRRSRRKYHVLIAAAICMLAFGMTSLGDEKKIVQQVKNMIARREQTRTGSSDEKTIDVKTIDELDFYEEVKEKLGFDLVHMEYMPEGMKLVETIIEEEMQVARYRYVDEKNRSITCRVYTNHRENSIGTDMVDSIVQEYDKDVDGTIVSIKECDEIESGREKWMASFIYEDHQYQFIIRGMEQSEVEKIVENLKLF